VHHLGFVELQSECVLIEGNQLVIWDTCIGTLTGVDETQHPHHHKVLFAGPRRITGAKLGVRPRDRTPRQSGSLMLFLTSSITA